MSSTGSTYWTLVECAAHGDVEQRSRFVDVYTPVVRTYLQARWRDRVQRQDLDDAVQEVFFADSGLACSLLGITRPNQLEHHPLRSAIFESWVAVEIYKARVHAGLVPALHHLRAISSIEVDLTHERGPEVSLIDVKLGATVAASFLSKLNRARAAVETAEDWREVVCYLVHGGEADRAQSGVRLVPWNALDGVDWRDR